MRSSNLLNNTLRISAAITTLVLLCLLIFLALKSFPYFQHQGISSLFTEAWYPTENEFNVLPMLSASILLTIGSVAMAAPVGVLLALFGRYYANGAIAGVFRALIELLSGVPSVVYGFWGLLVLVPLINQIAAPGASLLTGCLVLALMILPLVVLSADTAFSQIPQQWLQAADAMGLSQWGKIRHLILPNARAGILAGTSLQTGRALGETMAVLMVCGNIVQIPGSLFDPVRALTANIALEMAYATGDHLLALFVSGLILLLFTIFSVLAVSGKGQGIGTA